MKFDSPLFSKLVLLMSSIPSLDSEFVRLTAPSPAGMNTVNGAFDVVGDLLSALKDGAFS